MKSQSSGPEPSSGDSAIIQAENVRKTYHAGAIKVEALRGIHLQVKKGEMVAVMGPSGCGKTTLLNCASGLDDVTDGRVLIEGMEVASMSDNYRSELRAQRMGFIFQAYNLLTVLTSLENVMLPLLVSGIRENQARQQALEALKMVELEDWKSHKPMELSGGQQQRVAIARALVNNPAIVWGDEPTGNLDAENSKMIVDLLRRLNRETEVTQVLVTHDANIARVTDRILVMRDGLIQKQITPEEAMGSF